MHIERRISPDLAPPPGYAHVAVASGHRLVLTAGGVPLDPKGNPYLYRWPGAKNIGE